MSACNCGRSRCSREDPYTLRQANYGFYQQAAADCGVCNTLLAVHMPVFQPSTPTFRAASVKNNEDSADAPEVQAEGSGEGGTPGSGEGCEGSAWSPHALSPGSGRDDDQDDAPPDREGFDLVPVREETTSGNSYLGIYASST
ncbi:PREDICTED: protein SMG8-like, partial [Papilio polytes]|uniref:protein SMG8-like n=1 Tax=Papilio polytes TaxID=76194 RepID=UPI000675E81B